MSESMTRHESPNNARRRIANHNLDVDINRILDLKEYKQAKTYELFNWL